MSSFDTVVTPQAKFREGLDAASNRLPEPPPKLRFAPLHILLPFVVLATLAVLSIWGNQDTASNPNLYALWYLSMGAIVYLFVVSGRALTGSKYGLAIDNRNKVSLSRLQMVAWTVLIGGTLYTAFLWNVSLGGGTNFLQTALSIEMDDNLYALLGIGAISTIGSPLVRSAKTGTAAKAAETDKTVRDLSVMSDLDRNQVQTTGQVVVNRDVRNARLSDIFRGEETGNATTLDIGKVQMAIFTLVAWVAYAVVVQSLLADQLAIAAKMEGVTGDALDTIRAEAKIAALPEIASGMLALLAISHGGYLGLKAVPQSQPSTGGDEDPGSKGNGGKTRTPVGRLILR